VIPIRRLGLLAVAVLTAAPYRLAGQQDPATTPLVLRLPASTRGLGLGNAFAAGRGVEMLFYNPAQIGSARGSSLSYERFRSKSWLGGFVTAGALGRFPVAAGVQYLDFETDFFGLTRPGDLTTEHPFRASSIVGSVGSGFSWKGFRWGAAVKYAEEHRLFTKAGQVLGDVGVARDFGRIGLGLALQNIGQDLVLAEQAGRIPTRLSVGAYMPTRRIATYFDLAMNAGVSLERSGRLMPGGGAELTWEPVGGWRVAARAGLRKVEGGAPSESPFTFGGSFTLDRFSLDYAFVPYRRGSPAPPEVGAAAHRIGIRIQ
jgi:hypothetical protein